MSFSVKSIGFGTEESNDELVVLDELLEAITVTAVEGGPDFLTT